MPHVTYRSFRKNERLAVLRTQDAINRAVHLGQVSRLPELMQRLDGLTQRRRDLNREASA